MNKNMLSCRVNGTLNGAVRERAESEGMAVSDVIIKILNNEFGLDHDIIQNENEEEKTSINVLKVTQKIQKLNSQINELKEPYPDDCPDYIQASIEALKIDIQKLVDTLPKKVKEESKDFFGDWL